MVSNEMEKLMHVNLAFLVFPCLLIFFRNFANIGEFFARNYLTKILWKNVCQISNYMLQRPFLVQFYCSGMPKLCKKNLFVIL